MDTPNTLIIHHRGCNDGICGALVLYYALTNGHDDNSIEVRSAQYGEEPLPDEVFEDKYVYIVDFSYPREVLDHINEISASLLVLDHHKTAKKNCEGLDYAHFMEDTSGAGLAYAWVVRKGLLDKYTNTFVMALGALVVYVQDRDLWKWEVKKSREVSAWLASYDRTIPAWKEILHTFFKGDLDEIINGGAAILRSQAKQITLLAGRRWYGGFVDDNGIVQNEVCVIANAPILQSEVAERMLEEEGCFEHQAEVAVVWFQLPDGTFVYSLRSRGDAPCDVSAIAKDYGGGGHAKAAGFKSCLPPETLFSRI